MNASERQSVDSSEMAELHAVTIELSRASSPDELCRRFIELGRERLGFGRLGLWLVGDDPQVLVGTYGTDEQGRVRSERDGRADLRADTPLRQVVCEKRRFARRDGTELYDHSRHVVGRGTLAAATAWDGDRIVGAVCADNFLNGAPFTQAQEQLLVLYAATFGHLYQRFQAEEELRASERKYRTLVENAEADISIVRADGTFTFINCTAAAALGGRPGDLVGKTMWDLFPAEIADRQVAHIRQAIAAGKGSVTESATIVRGQKRWYRTSVQPLAGGGEAPDAALVIAADVTDRRQAEEAAREGEAAERCLRERLSLLHEANIELSATRPFDELCRKAIELAREKLGIDRAGLWFCTEKQGVVRGSFGTDQFGHTRDERDMVNRVRRGTPAGRIVYGRRRSVESTDAILYDEAGRVTARGQEIVASLWDGQNVVGFISADNLLSGRLMDRQMRDTLALYAVGVGHLVSRARAEESLRQSEAVARALMNASSERALLIEADGTILALNDTAARAMHGPQEELVGRCVWDVIPPELARTRRAILDEVVRTGQPRRFTDQRDGRWLDNNYHPVFDAEGRVVRLAVFARDVTEQLAAAEALMLSERRYRGLFEDSPVCLWEEDFSEVKKKIDALRRRGVKDFRGYFDRRPEVLEEMAALARVIDVNHATLEVYGAASKEQLLRELQTVFTTDSMVAFKEEIIALAAGARSIETEGVNRTLTGREIDVAVKVSLAPGVEEDWSRALVSIIDVTARTRAGEDLRQARDRLQYVIDNTSDAIFEMDLKGNYTFAAASAERMTGYALAELIGMNMSQLVAPEFQKEVFTRLARRAAGEDMPQPFYFEIVHKDGHRIAVELTTTGVYRDGQMVAVQGIARDITERLRTQQALEAARARLTGAREGERRRLAGELHDSVGQGLVAMQFGLRALLPKTGGVGLEQIEKMGALCDELIREVRRICRGLYPATLASLGLGAALRQLAQDFQGQTDVAVECLCPPKVKRLAPEVEIALFRIAQEAVNNAVRHGRAGRVQIALSCKRGQAVLTVTDNGRGFDVAAPPGGGLGLPMMKDRMTSVAGRLEITSRRKLTQVIATAPTALPAGVSGDQ